MPPGGHKRNITVTVQLTRVFGRPPVGLGGIPALGGVVKGRVVAERGPVLLRALVIGGGRRLRRTDGRTDGYVVRRGGAKASRCALLPGKARRPQSLHGRTDGQTRRQEVHKNDLY